MNWTEHLKNQWKKLHKMFHPIEILDFSFPKELQNLEKLPENWKNYHSLMTRFSFDRHILTEIPASEFLHM